ncbi:MAG: diguanylate cyclase [Desulfuromonas sp.]|nr:diguanylate cyclase [Desulfuromonas sp.]
MGSDQSLNEKNIQICERCTELLEDARALEEFIGRTNEQLLKSEMSNMELEQIFSSCVDPMLVVREDGIIVRANRQMLQHLNHSLNEVIGRHCSELLSAEECPLSRNKRETVQTDIELVNSKGETTSFIMTTSPLVTLDGSPGTLAQYKEITDRKQAERALAEAHETLKRIARIDGLTQIPNRRTFDETLNSKWQHLTRLQQPLSIILCDIDFFKKYNDSYGHQQGDNCLVRVAQALASAVPESGGLAARYGGEEFIFLLPETPLNDAIAIAETARQKVEQLTIEHRTSDICPIVTLSLGVSSVIPSADTSSLELIKAADAVLYTSKENGRNRVTAAE